MACSIFWTKDKPGVSRSAGTDLACPLRSAAHPHDPSTSLWGFQKFKVQARFTPRTKRRTFLFLFNLQFPVSRDTKESKLWNHYLESSQMARTSPLAWNWTRSVGCVPWEMRKCRYITDLFCASWHDKWTTWLYRHNAKGCSKRYRMNPDFHRGEDSCCSLALIVTPCVLVSGNQRFRGTWYFNLQDRTVP